MQEIRLGELVRHVATGTMALPEFQRDFVWDPSKVVELLDSVSNGWPIGSLLLLEGPQPFRIKPIDGGPLVDPKAVKFFLLDGQQRATSLFHALADTGDVVYYVDIHDEDVDEDGVPPIRWTRRRKTLPSSAFLIASLVDQRTFQKMSLELPSEDISLLERVRDRRLGYLLRDQYALSTIVMSENIELEALTRIFETLNRTGVRLDAFDLMVAVLYSPTFHLRDEWKMAQDEYPQLTRMDTNGVEVLKLIALWARRDHRDSRDETLRRVTGVRQRDVLNIPSGFVKEHWGPATKAYAAALDFLMRLIGVTHGRANPSEAMTLTIAYHLARGVSIRHLERWYWRSVIAQQYGQGANTQVLSDVDDLDIGREIDTSALLSQLDVGLMDQNRRNRILRLGIRALLLRQGVGDPITLDPLAETAESVSLSSLRDGTGNYAVGESLVVDMLLCTPSTASELRKAARVASGLPPLLSPALERQAFPVETMQLDEATWRKRRVQELKSRLGALI